MASYIKSSFDEIDLPIKVLDAIAISSGPGSYTGLRIGSSMTKGLAYTLDKPVISVNTLEAMAIGMNKSSDLKPDFYIPMIDARRNEVYLQVFDKKLKPLDKAQALILDNADFSKYKGHILFGGDGSIKWQEQSLKNQQWSFDTKAYLSAEYVGLSALNPLKKEAYSDVAYFEPNYLKEFTGR